MVVDQAVGEVLPERPSTPTARINLVHTASANYAGVQDQILGAVTRHLEPGAFSTTVGAKAPGSLNFSLFILQPTDVLMSHCLADKNYFFRKDADGERISNRLSHLLVPGEWLKRRILKAKNLDVRPDQVHVVGWPRLDALFAAQRQRAAAGHEPGRRPRVLWAPTHDYARRGENRDSLSSYPELLEHVPMLEKHVDLSISLHPRNRTDKQPTQHSLVDCDYVISDFGTIVYEAWALGKPVIFPHWLIGDRITEHLGASAESHVFSQRLGLHADSPQQMVDFIRDGAGIDRRTTRFIDDYLARQYDGTSGARVASLLQSLAP